jgi:hypothetical protein
MTQVTRREPVKNIFDIHQIFKFRRANEKVEEITLAKIHYVLTYKTKSGEAEKQKQERANYIQNLETNKLKLQIFDKEDSEVNYVLIETPLDVFFDIAEKLKLKLPIADNDLHEATMQKLYDLVTPEAIKAKKGRSYFTAAYEAKYYDK